MTVLEFLLILIPIAANAAYPTRFLKHSTILAASVEVILSLFIMRSPQITGLFYVTALTSIFIVMVSSIYLLSSIYASKYFTDGMSERSIKTYYFMSNFFVASMLFSLVINNYGLMWVGIEATTVSSVLLIMVERSETSVEAAWRYLIIASAGIGLAFISIILIYYDFHTLTVTQILAMPSRITLLSHIIAVIALVGFGTKVGLFPVHTWLPDAHSESPPPVSALFSGVLVPTALYVLYMVYQIAPTMPFYAGFAVATIVASSVFMSYQYRYKRMFAYSTMENMSMALLGLVLGGVGIIGASILLVSHTFAKSAAFYSSGNIFLQKKTKIIGEVTGIWSSMKTTSASLLLSSLAVTGAPPFGIFVGEFIILLRLASLHLYLIFAVVLFFLGASFVAVNYNITLMLFEGKDEGKDVGGVLRVIPLISAIVSLLIGIFALVVMNYAIL
ncbi:MAG: hydrogenase 4 subunit F [Thermoplasmatales archaeon]|nr:hydrogenase 4 subunit F [Thermoplasmatales archaeon]